MIDGGLRKEFRDALPHWHWQSIESGGTGGGIPDSNFCLRGAEGWVEFKRTTGWAVPLLPTQVAWISRRVRAGGYCLIAVRQQRAGEDVLYLFDGRHAADLKQGGLKSVPAMGTWRRPWPWREVERLALEGYARRHEAQPL